MINNLNALKMGLVGASFLGAPTFEDCQAEKFDICVNAMVTSYSYLCDYMMMNSNTEDSYDVSAISYFVMTSDQPGWNLFKGNYAVFYRRAAVLAPGFSDNLPDPVPYLRFVFRPPIRWTATRQAITI